MRNRSLVIGLLVFAGIISACSNHIVPKPRAYFRIDLPDKHYSPVGNDYPYMFEIPDYARYEAYAGDVDRSNSETRNWMDIHFDSFKAHLHLTYKPVNGELPGLIDDAHVFVDKHTIKADAILQTRYEHPDQRVYGVLFEIKGNAASSIQFFCTDSVNHFLRGALYFDAEPNKDSLAPVIKFLKKDVEHLLETLHWINTEP